jgi:lysophospholipase L1-like esterase
MRLLLPHRLITRSACALLFLVLPHITNASGIKTYLAVGDSLAFGFTDSTAPSFGDRGYVGDYANELAAQTGVRPYVINLGTYGETTSSFFAGGNPSATMNENYTDTSTSQNSLMLSTIAAQKASGDPISTVSVQLGANDLFAVAQSPGFFTKPADQQLAMIQSALSTVATNVGNVLGELRAQLPNADLIVMGYYNPYAAVPSNPFAADAAQAIQGLNAVLKADAQAFGARYVDTYTPFLGNEAAYTFITSSGSQYNVHPNDTGYQVIASQMEQVPEPSTFVVLGAGTLGLAAVRVRRRGPRS